MNALITLAIVILSALSGQDTTLTCFDAKAKLGADMGDAPIYFQVNDKLWPAHADDNEYPYWYSVSFPEDGEALQGPQTFKAIVVYGEAYQITAPLTVECGGSQVGHKIFLPLVTR